MRPPAPTPTRRPHRESAAARAPPNSNSAFAYPAPADGPLPVQVLRASRWPGPATRRSLATFDFPQNSFVWEIQKIDSRPPNHAWHARRASHAAKVQPAYPAPPPRRRRSRGSRVANPQSQPSLPGTSAGPDDGRPGPDLLATSLSRPQRTPVSRDVCWGNRGEGRLTLSRS